MDIDLSELEHEFRSSWRSFYPQAYERFLARAPSSARLELLVRLLSVELEYAFQPPENVVANGNSLRDEDDERVRPCVQLFMVRFPELVHWPDLLIRIIVLEYALRLRYDAQRPSIDSYTSLCTTQSARLATLLKLTESKIGFASQEEETEDPPPGKSDSTVKDALLSESLSMQPLPLTLGCFLLIRQLGRGGMGYVHFAIDLRSIAQVAVKVMRRDDAWSIHRFNEEFRWLSHLSHPNLVKLYDAFCESDVRYFSMELVEGSTIGDWFRKLRRTSSNPWTDLKHVLSQVADAIQHLHIRNVIHCDIKCTNMMITPTRRAVLLDLGLAVRGGFESHPVGALQYLAPEILEGKKATCSSDWFSFGVVIYELISNSIPLISAVDPERATSLSAKSFVVDEEKLEQELADSPAELRQLCRDLLSIDPVERPRGEEVLSRLSGGREDSSFILRPEFQGRDAEISFIDDALARRPGDKSRLLLVQGESGIGKTTLVQHWIENRVPLDCLPLFVRCYRQDHTPVRLLNALLQELVSTISHLPEAMWKPSLQMHLNQMSVLFPQVHQVLVGSNGPRQYSKSIARLDTTREQSIQSFNRWLAAISKHYYMVICVDDAQWADSDSIRALNSLLKETHEFQGSVILVDGSEEHQIAELLLDDSTSQDRSAIRHFSQLTVPPLSLAASIGLVDDWAKKARVELDPSITADIYRRSGGNPFLLQEIFRGYLLHARRGKVASADWLVFDLEASTQSRYGMLPQAAEKLLQFLAVAHQPIGFHQLQMVTRILPHELQHSVSLLASQGWIRSRGQQIDANIEIAHDRFRKVILESMTPERLQRRHFRMARILSTETPPAWAQIAYHYWLAEHFREAATCYLEAARSAIATSSCEEAIEFLDLASHRDAERTTQEQLEVDRLRAECLGKIGNSQASAEIYDRLALSASTSQQALILQCHAGDQWIRAGQLDRGLPRLKLGLKELGVVNLKKNAISYFNLVFRLLRIALFSPINRRKRNAMDTKVESFTELEKLLNRIVTPLTFLDSQLGPTVILRISDHADDHGSAFDRSLALMRSGILLSFGGRMLRRKALKRMSLGRLLARVCRSDEALATSQFCMYIWHTQRGQIIPGLRRANAALQIYQRCPASTQWEQQFLQWAMLGNYFYSNQLLKLKNLTESLRHSAAHRHDRMSSYWMHVGSAHISDLIADNLEQSRVSLVTAQSAIANQTFQSPRFFLWLSAIQQLLYMGDAQEAGRLLERDWDQLAKSLVMSTNHYRWLALNTKLCCNLLVARQAKRHASCLRIARDCVRQMLRLEEKAFVEYGNAFSLAVEAVAGNVAKLELWLETATKLGAMGHHLMATAVRWHAGIHFKHDPQAASLSSDAENQLSEQGCAQPAKFLNFVLPLPLSDNDESDKNRGLQQN